MGYADGRLGGLRVDAARKNGQAAGAFAGGRVIKEEVMKVSAKSRRSKRAPTDAETIRAASELYHDEGRIEIDLVAGLPRGRVSRAAGNGSGGAYVLA